MNNKEALEVLLNNYKSGKLERVVKEYGVDEVTIELAGALELGSGEYDAWVISGVEMKKLNRVYKAVGLGDTRKTFTQQK